MILNGIQTAQNDLQVKIYHDIISKYDVKCFFELGSYMGGLSYEIMTTEPSVDFWGFQLDMAELHEKVRGNERIKHMNVFSADCIDFVRAKINACNGTALVFCDNGNKEKEMETYHGLLRVGDLIQMHDFPGEATPEYLAAFGASHPGFEELDKDYYRGNGFTLWRRVA